jgi:prevent-host-death family protein
MRVSSADFIKNYGRLTDRALSEPVTITRNGRDRLVVLSVQEYERMKQRDRAVLGLEEFTDEEIAAIAKAEVPAGHDDLDAEMDDGSR